MLQSIPGLCPHPTADDPSSSLCSVFDSVWHGISLYDRKDDLHVDPVENGADAPLNNEDLASNE